MYKIPICYMLAVLLSATTVLAQTGRVIDNLNLRSKILDMDRKFAVYLPAGYETSQRSYPVLYLLHGSGDDQSGWIQFGEVMQITDQAVKQGSATEMIIVMPDANTGERGYFNSIDGKFRYEDYFFNELIPFVEKSFRVRTEKRYRAIAGLSMGGGGTIVYALHHPELFAAACPLSAGRGLQDRETTINMYKSSHPGLPDEVYENYYRQHNGFELVAGIAKEQVNATRWYIDCGDDDPRSETNAKLHSMMNLKGIPHEFRIRDGGHTWTYWRTALPDVLAFVTQSFRQF